MMSLRRASVDRPRVEEWSLLILTVLVALSFLRAEGSPDVPTFLVWTRRALQLGLVQGYAGITIDYPPLSLVLLHASALLSRSVGLTLFLGLKVSLLLALLLTGLVFRRGFGPLPLTLGVVAVLIPCSVSLGYLDVYYAPLLLLALFALREGRWGAFGFCYSAACLVKWQPLVLGPFLFAYVWKQGPQAFRRALGFAAVPMVILFLLFGPEMLHAFLRALSDRGLSSNALNLWWLVTHALHATWPAVFGPLQGGTAGHIYSPYGAFLQIVVLRLPFLLSFAAVFISLWRREARFPLLLSHALVGYLAYFMLATGVHENHLFVPVLLAAVMAARDGEGRRFLIWASVFNANLWVFYGASGRMPVGRVLGLDLALPLSVLNLWFFALALTALHDEPES
jgi:hypothetical protein